MTRYQQVQYKVPVGGKWKLFDDKLIVAAEKRGDPLGKWADERITAMQKNPLAFYLPHGRPRADGSNDGVAMLSDWEHDLILLTAPNQVGKTYSMAAKIGMLCGESDSSWPIFSEHGVKPPEWTGPKQIIIASYSLDNVNVVIQTYFEILPREWLGHYSPHWGCFKGEQGNQKEVSFHGHTKTIKLTTDTELVLLCYTQNLTHFETRQADAAHLDEQAKEEQFDGVAARQRTRGDFTPIYMSLTGYCLPDRPDTGAQGWINQKIAKGTSDKGRKIAQYKIAMEDVPDVIVSKAKKQEAYRQWVEEPQALHDELRIRQGVARYYGGWEEGGGLVLSEWNDAIHVIAPFDIWKYKPTLFREVDHGKVPCAALLFAVLPWGDAVMFKEYYEFDHTIGDNARRIVEDFCGNKRVKVDEFTEDGQTWPVYQEEFTTMGFLASEVDGRSFARKSEETNRTIGSLYQQFGLTCVPASCEHNLLDNLHQWLGLDKTRVHINIRLGRPPTDETTLYGAPRLYAFSGLPRLLSEVLGYCINQKTGKPIDKDDHLISCMRQFVAYDRPYLGDYGMDRDDKEESVKSAQNTSGSSETGY